MKRIFLSLFALTLAFGFACNPQPASNGNANRSISTAVAPAHIIPVVITLGTKPLNTKTYYLSIAPDSVTLSVTNGDQIQWIVSNPFKGLTLSKLQITNFKGTVYGGTDPFNNGGQFSFGLVTSQSASDTQSGVGIKGSGYDAYTYDVRGKLTLEDGKQVDVVIEPQVIINE